VPPVELLPPAVVDNPTHELAYTGSFTGQAVGLAAFLILIGGLCYLLTRKDLAP
jgi:hypothetical protein